MHPSAAQLLIGMMMQSSQDSDELGEGQTWIFDDRYLPPAEDNIPISLNTPTMLINTGFSEGEPTVAGTDVRYTIPTLQTIPDVNVWVYMGWSSDEPLSIGSDQLPGYVAMTDPDCALFDVGDYNPVIYGHYALRGNGQFIHAGRSDPSFFPLSLGRPPDGANGIIIWLFNPNTGAHYMGRFVSGRPNWYDRDRNIILGTDGEPTNELAVITAATPYVSLGNMEGRRLAAQVRDPGDRVIILQRPIELGGKPSGAIYLEDLPTGPICGDNGTGDGAVGDAINVDIHAVYVITQKYASNGVSVGKQFGYIVIDPV